MKHRNQDFGWEEMKKTDFFRFGFVALYNRKERESKWVPIIDKEKKMVAVMIKMFC